MGDGRRWRGGGIYTGIGIGTQTTRGGGGRRDYSNSKLQLGKGKLEAEETLYQ